MADNPFLLPPGSTPTPPPEPTIVPSAAPPARDPDRYIAVPPSIESATHRIARPQAVPAESVPAQTASAETASAQTASTESPVAEETRLAAVPPRPTATAWSLVLPDGTRVPVDGPILLGRDPSPPASDPDARPVALVDPGKTVSKTHALLRPAEPDGGGILVSDLHSTNGTAVTVGGTRTVLVPGGDGVAPVGAVIELGGFTLLVDAR